MSGSNDASLQALLLGMRNQQRRPSAQARLAEQMMASLNNPAPIYGAGPAIARVGSGVLAGLMSGMAERSDQEREDRQLQQVQDRQDKTTYLQGQEAADFSRRFRLPGAAPAEPPAEGQPAAPQGPVDWRGAALAGLSSNNPAIQRQAQAALSIGQMEDQQAARREQMQLQRSLAAASRPPDEFARALAAAGINPNSEEGRNLARQRLERLSGDRPPATREERDDSVLFASGANPDSPEYAQAYFRRFMTPRLQTFRGPNGEMMQAEVTLSPPPGLRPPAAFQGAQAPSAAPGVVPAMAVTPQAAAPMQTSGPVMSDGPTQAPPAPGAPALPMPNSGAVPNVTGGAPAARGMNINPLFSGERQTPLPPGYERDPADPSRARPIPGTAAAANVEKTERATANQERNTRQQADIVVSDVNRILRIMDTSRVPVSGFLAETASRVPGSPAADVRATLDTLEAAAAFGSLQAMRDASPTGAALGAVSDTELRLLSATMGSLRQSQSPQQFRRNLERFRDLFEQTVHGPNRGAPGSANNPAPAPGRQAAPPPGRARFNPATGEIE